MAGLDELNAQRWQLEDDIATFSTRLEQMEAEWLLEIRTQKEKADALAVQFKPLVPQAVEAYASGQKALAKDISRRRKALQAECEMLNAHVQELRRQLRDFKNSRPHLLHELERVNRCISAFVEAHPTRNIDVIGFRNARGITEGVIREELGQLPSKVLTYIARVLYIDEVAADFAVGRTASKAENPDSTTISLYVNLKSFEYDELERDYRHTLLHEAGHVVFDWVMTVKQRLMWGSIFTKTLQEGDKFISDYAATSLREDFGECFAMYMHQPALLRKKHIIRYTFIDGIYKEIAQCE